LGTIAILISQRSVQGKPEAKPEAKADAYNQYSWPYGIGGGGLGGPGGFGGIGQMGQIGGGVVSTGMGNCFQCGYCKAVSLSIPVPRLD
jgi:hypothetical protein